MSNSEEKIDTKLKDEEISSNLKETSNKDTEIKNRVKEKR